MCVMIIMFEILGLYHKKEVNRCGKPILFIFFLALQVISFPYKCEMKINLKVWKKKIKKITKIF